MTGRTHALAQQLTGKQSLEECSVQELKQLAQRYPYFAPVQFLLLQKLRQEGPATEAESQSKKAILYYPNPLQFELFIAAGNLFGETRTPLDENLSTTYTGDEGSVVDIEHDTVQENGNDVEEGRTFFENEDSLTASDEIARPNVTEQTPVVIADRQNIEERQIVNTTEQIEAVEPDIAEEQQLDRHEASPFTPSESVSLEQSNAELTPQKEETSAVKRDADALAFEPYHTVDYFASQGIKISAEEFPKDKLGKQMKSFTEWLKSMKRLPTSQITESVESTAEKKVESMASHSVSESEVVTEAMAEVWAKQGNSEKALDIYNKLLLLNPSKKAYFAAKIETLKQS